VDPVNVNVGLLVEVIELLAVPEKPFVFEVTNVPLMLTFPVVPNDVTLVLAFIVPATFNVPDVPKVIVLVPALIVDPASTRSDLVLLSVTAKLPVLKTLPDVMLPTRISPATLAAVSAAGSVTPAVLLMNK
jgi:hypothetical protein